MGWKRHEDRLSQAFTSDAVDPHCWGVAIQGKKNETTHFWYSLRMLWKALRIPVKKKKVQELKNVSLPLLFLS